MTDPKIAPSTSAYRGRFAPTPSGWLHAGHARTFWVAAKRAAESGGEMLLRIEDIDRDRCRPEFEAGIFEDLNWLGLQWTEGPDQPGPWGPYHQSQRGHLYREAWEILKQKKMIYPSPESRREIGAKARRTEADDGQLLFPKELRHPTTDVDRPGPLPWRFRVPDGRTILFRDGQEGEVSYTADIDFGDFLVWRRDDTPSYELAVVVDDYWMGITEVVRGADLLKSTARQLLLYEALGWSPPRFFHCPLLFDRHGVRLSKTAASTSLRSLREAGLSVNELEGEHASFYKKLLHP